MMAASLTFQTIHFQVEKQNLCCVHCKIRKCIFVSKNTKFHYQRVTYTLRFNLTNKQAYSKAEKIEWYCRTALFSSLDFCPKSGLCVSFKNGAH